MTVRQLEAMVRLEEARARVDLDPIIQVRRAGAAASPVDRKVDHDDVDVDLFGDDAYDDEMNRAAEAAEAAAAAAMAEEAAAAAAQQQQQVAAGGRWWTRWGAAAAAAAAGRRPR